jgi:hypothetical protein
MEISNQQLKEAVTFYIDLLYHSETDGDIVKELTFFPESIDTFTVLTNGSKIFEKYTNAESYEAIHSYVDSHFGEKIDDYNIGFGLMTITAVADTLTNILYSERDNLKNKETNSSKMNNIRNLILYYMSA